ncbi:MAG: methylated-DNA--[protein]-cysteine S-methyltransferase [Halofilum sp. (in: g-proteobacteria)]|nr:methylated-DNA--[protein]-cysteine S-methyltransferase [Halofilum sp. (in: g-proteobacteria)]
MSEAPYDAVWNGPLGRIGVRVSDDYVTDIDWLAAGPARTSTHPLAAETVRQLAAWFDDPGRFRFSLPLSPAPTPFQRRFRERLCAVPPGEVRTYGALAAELNSAPRAVGGACRANPLPLVVPCHRVVAADGIGGYGGDWGAGPAVDFKQRLLDLERRALGL